MPDDTLARKIMILKIIIRKLFPFTFSFNPLKLLGKKKRSQFGDSL